MTSDTRGLPVSLGGLGAAGGQGAGGGHFGTVVHRLEVSGVVVKLDVVFERKVSKVAAFLWQRYSGFGKF